MPSATDFLKDMGNEDNSSKDLTRLYWGTKESVGQKSLTATSLTVIPLQGLKTNPVVTFNYSYGFNLNKPPKKEDTYTFNFMNQIPTLGSKGIGSRHNVEDELDIFRYVYEKYPKVAKPSDDTFTRSEYVNMYGSKPVHSAVIEMPVLVVGSSNNQIRFYDKNNPTDVDGKIYVLNVSSKSKVENIINVLNTQPKDFPVTLRYERSAGSKRGSYNINIADFNLCAWVDSSKEIIDIINSEVIQNFRIKSWRFTTEDMLNGFDLIFNPEVVEDLRTWYHSRESEIKELEESLGVLKFKKAENNEEHPF